MNGIFAIYFAAILGVFCELVARLEEAFLERGLPLELLDKKEKLVPLKGDVTQERLGLGEGVFNEVRKFFSLFCHMKMGFIGFFFR